MNILKSDVSYEDKVRHIRTFPLDTQVRWGILCAIDVSNNDSIKQQLNLLLKVISFECPTDIDKILFRKVANAANAAYAANAANAAAYAANAAAYAASAAACAAYAAAYAAANAAYAASAASAAANAANAAANARQKQQQHNIELFISLLKPKYINMPEDDDV